MKNLVLIGGGGHCKAVLDTAIAMDAFDKIVITDPGLEKGTSILGCEVVGGDDCLECLRLEGYGYAFIAVGGVCINPLREKLVKKASSYGYSFPSVIDPSATISNSAKIGEGTFVGKGVVINAETAVGNHCIVNTGAIIEHECNVGEYSHISVGTILCGRVSVGRNCMIGSGSAVIQGIKIEDNCIVGAGAVVIKDVQHGSKVAGVPARRLV